MFGKKKQAAFKAQTVAREPSAAGFWGFEAQGRAERELFAALRESVPVIDAAIGKIVRLTGSFSVKCRDALAQEEASRFIGDVKCNGSSQGLAAFVYSYLDSMLTFGEAVGEMVPYPDGSGICALYNASLDDAVIRAGSSPLELTVLRRGVDGDKPVEKPDFVLAGLLNQKPGTVKGTSVLEGLPFVSSILLRIFESVKRNWERAGDIRFAVTYDPKDGSFNEDSAALLADEWKKAMHSDRVCDFVSVGNVSVKVIGAENQMPDCEVPLRAVMEQLVAKLGIPPFLLGISWSSTERMSAQQADILTSELEYYRAALEPVIKRVLSTHLRMAGCDSRFEIIWSDINLQDAVELSTARLNNARAMQLEREYGLEVENE